MLIYNSIRFLIVDDDPVDKRALKRQFAKQKISNKILEARDGEEALEMLRDPQNESENDTIVLLDINMPGMNGHDFLAELRADPKLVKTKVFILSSSDNQKDIDKAFEKNVAGYLRKKNIGEELVKMKTILNTLSTSDKTP